MITRRNDPATSLFPDELVSQIAEKIGLTDKRAIRILAGDLRRMPEFIQIYQNRDSAGTPTERLKRLRPVLASCQAAIASIGYDPIRIERNEVPRGDAGLPQLIWSYGKLLDPDRPERAIIDGAAGKRLADTLRAIEELRDMAQQAIDRAEETKGQGRGGARRKGDRVLHDITRELLYLYQFATGRDVGTSVKPDTGEPSGPVIRYLQICLPHLGWELTPKAIRSLIQRVKHDLFQ